MALGRPRPLSPRPSSPFAGGPRRIGAALVWALVALRVLRALAIVGALGAGFILVSALLGGVVEETRWVVVGSVVVVLVVPLALRAWLAAFLARHHRRLRGYAGTFVALTNVGMVLVLSLGFADQVGRVLRRRGDWFLGEWNGFVARTLRGGLERAALALERFDPPPELAPVVIPPDPATVPYGPWPEGHEPPPQQPTMLAWYHPLAGPRRALPLSASRRFGAERPQPRPRECELGHCGVDLGSTVGEPVFAVFDGVVERIEREEDRGGRAGRYIRIGHKDGTVVSRYIHLDTIRADLREGQLVKGGELIGRLGRSGVEHSGPHLHFGLSMREGGRSGKETYVDPEPYLRRWTLVDPRTLVAAR